MKKREAYYLGLDIGTDSVGYAVTNQNYDLLKFKGEPMWGTHLFEGGQAAADRRLHRSSRRRIDRRQQRVSLINELFAGEIAKVDPYFFQRRKESSLYGDDSHYGVRMFGADTGLTDREYHEKYPTIHHLILELMISDEPHDIRLVYIACAWLVAHRGHFLFDIAPDRMDKLLDFDAVYSDFCQYLLDQNCTLPWESSVTADDILNILKMDAGVTRKKDAFKTRIYNGKKISKEYAEDFPYSREAMVTLLSGGSVKPGLLFDNETYGEIESVSLQMGDEDFDRIISELGDDGELLLKLRSMHNCVQLIATMSQKREQDPVCVSSSKVAIYEQHREDLKLLKRIVKRYCPQNYDEIFRSAQAGNYVSYTRNTKSCPEPNKVKGANKDVFCDYLKKKLKNLKVKAADKKAYENMMERLETRSFLPKQKDTDNRVIPQQLYRQELNEILRRAENYLPMLSDKDDTGLSVSEKILSVFDFRIPYYVGPLVKRSGSTAWIVRKQEKILPWNFSEVVDLDASEQQFIRNMINYCTYLPGKEVLPANSLLYEKFTVLNALNNLQVDGIQIPVAVKQALFTDLFLQQPRVTFRQIRNYLLSRGLITNGSLISGLDVTFKAGLKSYHIFKRMLCAGVLREADVEEIIRHAAFTEDKGRMKKWLKKEFPQLPEEDVAYILRQKLKEFGRLSGELLVDLYGTEVDSDGEAFTIMEALWNTNQNLMQLLSGKYTFADQISAYSREYYSDKPRNMDDFLSEMYVSNAGKRAIYRTWDIVQDVVKAKGGAPARIFVEMARGGTQDQKGKRTQSRKDQLLALYKTVKTEDSRKLENELQAMGTAADNRLQDRKLFLYYLQLGKCLYTGHPIDLTKLSDGTYNLDHIYPQSQVKDDSLLNNLVLVESNANGQKSDVYPVAKEIQEKMGAYWTMLRTNGLMTEEKHRRLIRTKPFTQDEKMGFINRQLVETRQSTKAITALLKEKFPDTQIVYVKAGLVSEFRQEFGLLKCRSVNDLHHAKDAYLNIVVGNVYDQRFTKNWFRVDQPYNVQAKKLFTASHRHGDLVYWDGEKDLAKVRKTVGKNAVHLTRYAFCRKGGLFDQQPVKKAPGLIPLKNGLPTERYGGYNKPTASCYVLARFMLDGKSEIMLVPVELHVRDAVLSDGNRLLKYVETTIESILEKCPQDTQLLLKGRILKINTVISLDGTMMTLAGKSSGGKNILLSPVAPLILSAEWERYAKCLESFRKKTEISKNLEPDEIHDGIFREKNVAFYRLLTEKLNAWPFVNYPGNQGQTLAQGIDKFAAEQTKVQITCLLNILTMMGPGAAAVDLTACGGTSKAGAKVINAKLSNWKKRYREVRIVDVSASGLFRKAGCNLLELL